MSELSSYGRVGPGFEGRQKAFFEEPLAPVISITDAIKAPETQAGPRRLDIRDPHDVRAAANLLLSGEPVFARFGNILGVFGHPDEEVVGDINEFKGRSRTQTGSITTTPEHYAKVADWDKLNPKEIIPGTGLRLDREMALDLIHDLSEDGPVGVLLPAADHIPGHLSRSIERPDGTLRTVQLIVPGKDCPSTDVFAAAVEQMPEHPYVFATSGNMSKAVMKAEQPAHYDYQPLVNEFAEQGKGNIIVVTDNETDELTVNDRHPYHDRRSTTILRLDDVLRNEDDGSPKLDEEGRPILIVQRHGSMLEGHLREVLSEHGFGVVFPPEHMRVPTRDSESKGNILFDRKAPKIS